jgi:tRNA nucleotidyltransferase (CCA-adding enzyme)
MNIYLVGGAVRDELLGFPVKERDWVVVGSNVAEMDAQGFEQVGKDFPVFLHPKSKEEYALARIERKIAAGHKGFECDANSSVTLEEDLLRRDLTVNAIAKTADGSLVDPYNGMLDLKQHILRHVSPAFAEDPLRVLRLARFYARFPDFTVAKETLALASEMVEAGELSELAVERIWMEVQKALHTDQPSRFFDLLNQVGAHQLLWPAIQIEKISLLKKLEAGHPLPEQKFAALCWEASDDLKNQLTQLKIPNRFLDLALAASKHLDALLISKPTAETAVDLMYQLDAFRRPDRFRSLSELAISVARAEGRAAPAGWFTLYEKIGQISGAQIDSALKGPEFGRALRQARINELALHLTR